MLNFLGRVEFKKKKRLIEFCQSNRPFWKNIQLNLFSRVELLNIIFNRVLFWLKNIQLNFLRFVEHLKKNFNWIVSVMPKIWIKMFNQISKFFRTLKKNFNRVLSVVVQKYLKKMISKIFSVLSSIWKINLIAFVQSFS